MIEKRNKFRHIYPDKYFADKEDLQSMELYLKSIKFLDAEEVIYSAEVPGAGNMNYVLRVKTNKRNFILKQSRPWVEKYPSIEAPIARIAKEAEYYDCINGVSSLDNHSPEIYHFDNDNFVLIMEDLGEVQDFTFLYKEGSVIEDADVVKLAQYLSALHSVNVVGFPENLDMRRLNHIHIFNYPFDSGNGFDLDGVQDRLSTLAINETTNPDLVQLIRTAGDLYLATDGTTLLHGDFYPGSWMKSESLFVLDPEFAFAGPAEFDLGVFIAHMMISSQNDDKVKLLLDNYNNEQDIDVALAYKFAGIEILRRLLGVAQLPLELTIEQKASLVAQARETIMS